MNQDQDIDEFVESFPEVMPWVERINAAKSESELLAIVVQSIKDEELGKIGGLFYSGWAAASIGATATKLMKKMGLSLGDA